MKVNRDKSLSSLVELSHLDIDERFFDEYAKETREELYMFIIVGLLTTISTMIIFAMIVYGLRFLELF